MKFFSLLMFLLLLTNLGCSQKDMKYNKLSPEEENIIKYKGTEKPFSGKYYNFQEKGTYICKRCNSPLFRSEDKFESGCGWPSFDNEIPGAVKKQIDADGSRTEIVCANCGAHLGHVFTGEKFTPKDTRHCVNSISLNFIPAESDTKYDTAIFAGGCFWGMEYHFAKLKGVKSTTVGYTAGKKENPTYKEVCSGQTGHIEAIEIIYNTSETSFENLVKMFFEIHDPTQIDKQGPDIGEQYRSVVFYKDDTQKEIAENLIKILKDKGYKVATILQKAGTFWKAEEYHQNYYKKQGSTPYCHIYTKRF